MKNERDIFWSKTRAATTDTDLSGKVAIVTGGSRGIGKAIVENFLSNDAIVISVSRSDIETTKKENHHHKQCDVQKWKQVRALIEEVAEEFNKIDIIVNCAGYAYLTDIKEEGEELFDKIMDTNFKGVRNFFVAAAKHLEKTNGHIISLGSIWGLPGINLRGDSTYSAGDAAIIKYCEVASVELPDVHVNTISPALVQTSMNDDMTQEAREEFAQQYDGRDTLLQPEEIAEVAEYLVKNQISGKNIIIDAGYMKNNL